MMYFFFMVVSSLFLDNFRNYQNISIDIPKNGALFSGPNGSGKTNLLEAVFLLCTARSQRGATRSDLIRFGADYCFVKGEFSGAADKPHTSVAVGFDRNHKVSMKINDRPISSFSHWFGHSLVVSFSPDDLRLVQGHPKDRRAFLDLIISQLDPAYLDALICYKKTLAQRNNLLARRISDTQLEAFEEEMARYGSVIMLKRHEIINALMPYFTDFYSKICNENEHGTMQFFPSIRCDSATQNDWKNVFLESLKNAKQKDIQNGYSSVGPHRDDLLFFVNKKDARSFASLGQCTTIVLALRMASILVCEQYRKDDMIFLFDDAVSFLDTMRTSRVFPLLRDRGQILVTAPLNREPDDLDLPRFRINDGMILAQ